jgi:class 3 adenylate cyclase
MTPALLGLVRLAATDWELASESIAHHLGGWDDGARARQAAATLRTALNPDELERFTAQVNEWDVTELLPRLTMPVMLLPGEKYVGIDVQRQMARRLVDARIVDPGVSGEEREQAINAAIAQFLLSDITITPEHHSDTAFRTILFTDLVGHTEMMRRLGDDRGREVLREHERITRELLKEYGGAEVKTMGDGFMASFASVTKAMDCAIALQRAFAAHAASAVGEPLQVRVGLNAGEPIEEDGDLFGSTVIMASRIAAKAGAAEILIPEPLRHLLTGKSYVYADRGETMLKGFEDAVRLYEVRWQS